MARAPPPPTPDHHPLAARASAATRVEALGHATELGAPRDVLLEALLRLLGDADALAARLLAEPGDPAGRRAVLLLRAGGCREVFVGQGPDHHDLVILDRHVHPRE